MCPFFVYFGSSLEESLDEVQQIDPPPDTPPDTEKTKKKKEPKVVCVHVHPGAIATPPQTAFPTHCDTLQAEQSVPAPEKKPKEPEPAPESKGKKDKKQKEKEGQDKGDIPKKGKVPVAKVCLRGTCVPPLCTRLFPVVPDVPVPGYTCTHVLYPRVPPCPRCPIALLLHCRSPALPPWSRRSRAGPVRSQQRARAVIRRQQVTGISAARRVSPIPFPCHCIYEFSLSPCPPEVKRPLPDGARTDPGPLPDLPGLGGQEESRPEPCAAGGYFFSRLFCPVVRLVHAPSVSCSIPHRCLRSGGRCTGPVLWDPR